MGVLRRGRSVCAHLGNLLVPRLWVEARQIRLYRMLQGGGATPLADLRRASAAVLQRGVFRALRVGIFRARGLCRFPPGQAAVCRSAPLHPGGVNAFVSAKVPRHSAALSDPARGGAGPYICREARSVAGAYRIWTYICDGADDGIQSQRRTRRARMELQSVRVAA